MNDTVPPFGTYSLSGWRESLRQLASNAPNSRLGMWRISILRKLSLMGHKVGMQGRIDVVVAKDVHARVFPASNRCEKRVFAGVLTEPDVSRGTIAVAESGLGESIRLETLAELFVRAGVDHVDAMKIDIEGRDKAALKAMVEQAPKSLWPRLLIVEVGHRSDSPIVAQMLDYGYTLKERAGINAVLEFNADVEPRKAGV